MTIRTPLATAAALAGLLALAGLILVGASSAVPGATLFLAVAVLTTVAALGYLCIVSDPAWSLSGAVALSVFSGHWNALGLPSAVAPDRLLLLLGLATLILRLPGSAGRPILRVEPIHWLLLLVGVYAICSMVLAGTVLESAAVFRLVDRFGLVPFVVFFVAPVAFRTHEQRQIFLGVLVALGAYLGLTAFFEQVGPRALVFPSFITDPTIGIHVNRARGPFLEAVSNGFGLLTCAIAAGIGVITWSRVWARAVAAAVIALCAVGIVLTLTRSVWIGSTVAVLVVILATPELRRYALPVTLGAALLVTTALLLVPGLSASASGRADNKQTVWERDNLNVAALNMIDERPLVGFGWGRYQALNRDYLEQGSDYPLTKVGGITVHNAFLSNGAELGLVGTTLWVLALVLAVGGALRSRGSPELRPWRKGLLGIAICWFVVANLVNPNAFPMIALWAWAGIARGPAADDR